MEKIEFMKIDPQLPYGLAYQSRKVARPPRQHHQRRSQQRHAEQVPIHRVSPAPYSSPRLPARIVLAFRHAQHLLQALRLCPLCLRLRTTAGAEAQPGREECQRLRR